MRPIYLGLALFLAGILSATILGLADWFFRIPGAKVDGFYVINTSIFYEPNPFDVLGSISLGLGYSGLMFAIAIEAYLYPKGRKGHEEIS
jgi:hypothetical protein